MAEKKPRSHKFIKAAVKPENKGKFKAKAEAAGKSTREFADEKQHAPGKLGEEARFAKTVMGFSKQKSRYTDKKVMKRG